MTARENCGPILVVDGDEAARADLVQLFEGAGYRATAVASGEEALDAARDETPTAVVLEVPLAGAFSGYEVCRALRRTFGDDLAIIFLSGSRTESYDRVAGLLVGADDYVVKPYAGDEVLTRLRRLLRRADPLGPGVTARLTKRERQILRLLAEGLQQDEIAERLYISPKTVGTHIEHILSKLNVRSRTQAVALAYRDELVDVAS
jgi:DNA-binding NarL/FixJ family response regulator